MKGHVKLDLLMKDIQYNIEIFQKRRNRHSRQAILLKFSTIIASAFVTVLLGLKGMQNNIISNITLVLSVFISIFNGIEGYFNHRGLWVKDVKTLAGLDQLRRDIEFQMAGEDDENFPAKLLTVYKNRLQTILNDDIRNWTKIKEEQGLSEHEEKPIK